MTTRTGTGLTTESVSGALEDAISALACLDCERLQTIERKMSLMASFDEQEFASAWQGITVREVMAWHRILGSLIESTRLNLEVLQGLQRRNRMGDDRWVR